MSYLLPGALARNSIGNPSQQAEKSKAKQIHHGQDDVACGAATGKFQDPDFTQCGKQRAYVDFVQFDTLWFNTGTLCNIECVNCYIESNPRNDRLTFLTVDDIKSYLDEIKNDQWVVRNLGFTGGEPFVNPHMIKMARACLAYGHDILILTNAMRPMMRPKIRRALLDLKAEYGQKLQLRISIDHYTPKLHDHERGLGSFAQTITGIRWLGENGFSCSAAGRSCWGEEEKDARKGYQELFQHHGLEIDASNPAELILFPEMDGSLDVPEITTDCWDILHKKPREIMCASSRMIVKRKGDIRPVVLSCTLLPYLKEFEMGHSLRQATAQRVKLNHPHCAKFCVLGGASCSASKT